MRFQLVALLALLPGAIVSAPAPGPPPAPATFPQKTIFTPPSNYNIPKVLYARTALLPDNSLLATWENYSPEPPLVYFPIFASHDSGYTWKHISNITDQVNNFGLRYQPFLYTLPAPIGGFPAGTILAAGNSIPTDLSITQIDLYASTDKGYTWHFVSHIARGGEAIPDNGLTPVWEPFLLYWAGQLIVYYSDQRDPGYGQKLVHQTSHDLRTWSAPVNDVTYPVYTDRPGMPTIAELPNGKWIMTYEFGGGPSAFNISGYQFPVYYKIAATPLLFGSITGLPIVANNTQPTGSPYVVWSKDGGPFGTIAVSGGSNSQIFTNKKLGAVDAWVEIATEEEGAYTRHLRILPGKFNQPDRLLIIGAGQLPPSSDNVVSDSVMYI